MNVKKNLVKSFNESYSEQKCSISQRQGIITCIPKEGKSKLFSKSRRTSRPGMSSSSIFSIRSKISLVHSPIYLPFKRTDPLSLYLFILVLELLAAALENDKDITGVQIENSEFLLSQYADDSFLILDDNPHDNCNFPNKC
jgi:hypothetical protein